MCVDIYLFPQMFLKLSASVLIPVLQQTHKYFGKEILALRLLLFVSTSFAEIIIFSNNSVTQHDAAFSSWK